jgi:hypothetical protein
MDGRKRNTKKLSLISGKKEKKKRWIWMANYRNKFTVITVPTQCPLVLLVNVV